VDLVIEPRFVRVTVRGKVFQLRLEEEVRCDSAKAERSTTTGTLVVTMPRVREARKKMAKRVNSKY
jgi:protein TilB